MFCKCNNIIHIDFSKFNTQNVTDMKSMFYKCSSLTTLNLSSFVFSNENNTKDMFNKCSNLKIIKIDRKFYDKVKQPSGEKTIMFIEI